MRSYKQSCGLAKALDLVGDRWTLLIVRELLIRGACRYTDIRNGLPGIATNLLAERLEELEQSGIIVSKLEAPPIATTLFRLTERGRQLEPALLSLGAWGAPLLANRAKDEEFQSHWLVLPLKLLLVDNSPQQSRTSLELRMTHQTIAVTAENGKIDVRLGDAQSPAAVLSGEGQVILQMLAGRVSLTNAKTQGLSLQGSAAALRRFIPAPANRQASK
jgi:DNA-binding HxlR family transcriptional regulator